MDRDDKHRGVWQPGQADLIRHDMRAALADILGGLELLPASELSPKSKRQLTRVQAAARQLHRLTEMLDAEAKPSDAQPVTDLALLLQGILDRWSGHANAIGAAFSADIGLGPSVGVPLSGQDVERILGNLLENAFKYGEASPVQIIVVLDEGESVVSLRVRDRGRGIAEADRSAVLERGHRGAQRQAQGSGLGLYIVRQLVAQAGGKLTLNAGPDGRGLEATVELPVEVPITRPRRIDSTARLTGMRVLLVEDNPTNQLVAQKMLETLGATCRLCGDGIEGAAAVEQDRFDIALIDIEMPRKGGLALISELRAHGDPAVRDMPMVAVTAYALPEHRARIMAAGADGVIVKPLDDIAVFGAAVAEYLSANTAVVDASALAHLSDVLGAEGYAELRNRLTSDFASTRKRLEDGFTSADAKAVREATHALIALAGTVGATALQEGAQAMNRFMHDPEAGVPDPADGAAAALLRQLATVETSLQPNGHDKEHP